MAPTRPPALPSRLAIAYIFALTTLFYASAALAGEVAPGRVQFQAQCADCHGAEGEGIEGAYEARLAGEMTLVELTAYIEESMPDGAPEECVGEQAHAVAKFIYDDFYSYDARIRRGIVKPPRIELVRLTVPQYRNVTADLLAEFSPPAREKLSDAESKPGLRGSYFQSKGMSKAHQLKLERVDGSLVFDFQNGSPHEEITADQFCIIWQGSLHAEATGYYEFRVRTQNGARVYLNQEGMGGRATLRDDSEVSGQDAFIDGWVGSGQLRDEPGRIFLVGGRRYPLRVEFFKYLEETASLALEWKPPNSPWMTLDARHLSTADCRPTYVLDTPFPADDRSLGYERGSGVSREWHEATTNAAIATAEEMVRRLPQLVNLEGEDGGEGEMKDVVARFAALAFRRPLTDDEQALLTSAPFDGAPDLETGFRRAILLALQSPQFLYADLNLAEKSPQHAVAARLALALWDSLPDDELRQAATSGRLAAVEQVETQAWRMLDDPRAQNKVQGFFHHWLEIEERDLAKDKAMFPQFDEHVIADLRYSLEEFVQHVVWSDASDYRELLLADYLMLNDRLKQLYAPHRNRNLPSGEHGDAEANEPGEHEPHALASDHGNLEPHALASGESEPDVVAKAEAEETNADSKEPAEPANKVLAGAPPVEQFEPVDFPADRRAGVLTHPYLLSAFAYHNNTSPIHRGVFLTRNIVGRGLKPPPIAVAFKDDEFPADLTMREKITLLTRDTACMSCHSVINPLGYALENFDPVGRWRTSDNDKPVDSRSEYTTDDGQTIELAGARDIAEFAASSESAQQAFATQVFLHLVKQSPVAYDPDMIENLHEQFVADDYNIKKLLVRIAVLAAMHGVSLESTGEPTL